jgi:bacteriocin-like protein
MERANEKLIDMTELTDEELNVVNGGNAAQW